MLQRRRKIFIALILSIFLVLASLVIKFIPNSVDINKNNYEHVIPDQFQNESFSIIIATFAPRKFLMSLQLKKIIYGQCPHLKDVFIYWVDRKNPLPDETYFGVKKDEPHVPITILPTKTGFITDRFLPPSTLKTDTVLVMDDDLDTPGISIDNAFLVYKERHFEDRIFGLSPRAYRNGKYIQIDYDQPYTMVITNFAFLNVEMLKAYNLPEYQSLRDHCVTVRNCDDILMNYVVAAKYGKPPMAMKINVHHMGKFGISFGTGHKKKRDYCCKYFQDHFGFDVIGQHVQYYTMDMAW